MWGFAGGSPPANPHIEILFRLRRTNPEGFEGAAVINAGMMQGMIISASRRTDLPAFYARWFLNRLRAGYCEVVNPFNAHQRAHIPLTPQEVDLFVFWTRNPRPLFAGLDELDAQGYAYYFQYTLLDNPPALDPHAPPAPAAARTFRQLAGRIGPERVVWRYDPIVLARQTPPDFHRRVFERLSRELEGHTRRCVVSLVDDYARSRKRLAAALPGNQPPAPPSGASPPETGRLLADLGAMAQARGMEMVSCAEPSDLRPYGIQPGACIDGALIARLLGRSLPAGKDPAQRPACGCAASRDIGRYESCLFGCAYCYATGSFERARRYYRSHDPQSPAL